MKRETDDGTKINQLAVCDKQEGNQSREGGEKKKKRKEGGKKNSVAAVSLNPTWQPRMCLCWAKFSEQVKTLSKYILQDRERKDKLFFSH